MQLALTILAGFGVLLFLICLIGYVISGFRHHFVTGLIAIFPVLNIVTLPSLWDKNSKKFFIGFIGLIITSGAWLLGADKGFQNLVSSNNSVTEEVVISNNSGITQTNPINNAITHVKPKANFILNEGNMVRLPDKALYKMSFDVIPLGQINTLKGRIVQITNTDDELLEG